MAVGTATAIALGVGAAANIGTSTALAIGGNKRKRRAEAALRNLVPPELRNAYSDVPLSTYGSRIASQNMAQNNATMVNAAQKGGIRALTGVAPALTESNIQQNQAIMENIDTQYRQNKINEAQGAMRVQDMQEQRYQSALAGLQQERAAGLQDTYTGLSNAGQSIMSIGTMMYKAKNDEKKDGIGGGTSGVDSLGLRPDQYTSGLEVSRIEPQQTMPLRFPVPTGYRSEQTGMLYNLPGNQVQQQEFMPYPKFDFPIG